jgi:hypothetical protein
MPCNIIKDDNGKVKMIVCTRTKPTAKKCDCGKKADAFCDAVVNIDGRIRTCDKPLCNEHRNTVADDTDVCEEHNNEISVKLAIENRKTLL